MKPDKIILDEADKMEVVATIPDKTGKFKNSITPHPGHTLFEINVLTGKCKVAEYQEEKIQLVPQRNMINGQAQGITSKKSSEVIRNDGCIYISALNKKNALIKFFKKVGQQIEKNNQ